MNVHNLHPFILLPVIYLFAVLVITASSGCSENEGKSSGENSVIGAAPDYHLAKNWLALPGYPSAALQVPPGSGFSSLQDSALADVFYIHPTTSLRGDLQNAPIPDEQADQTADLMLLTQATPFNAIAKIYAPRYRQVTLPTYSLDKQSLQKPANLAYGDVLAAFNHYVSHYNHGRPFFLVGHSQGTNHAQRLLTEAIQGTPLEALLIAAYLPGQPIPRSVFKNDLQRIPPCDSPAQSGCVAIWQTFGEDQDEAALNEWQDENIYWHQGSHLWQTIPAGAPVSINPVSWDINIPVTSPDQHRGAIPFGTESTFKHLLPALVTVRDIRGYAFVSPALPAEYFNDGNIFGGSNYHVFDIPLFWLDIRENAHLRLNTWREQHGAHTPLLEVASRVVTDVNKSWSYRLATRYPANSFTVTELPAGLQLNSQLGIISGTPLEAGVYALHISASNAHGRYEAELSLIVQSDNQHEEILP